MVTTEWVGTASFPSAGRFRPSPKLFVSIHVADAACNYDLPYTASGVCQGAVDGPELERPRSETQYELFVSAIRGVEAIITWKSEDTTHLWTVIARLDEEVANQVYEVEAVLQETFHERFDFYVQAGQVERLREFLPSEAQFRFVRSL